MTAQRIAISGASGMIGSALTKRLRERGDEVVALHHQADADAPLIGPDGIPLAQALEGVDAVVNLAGAPIAGKRLTSSYLKTVRSSRVETTTALVEAMAAHDVSMRLVSGSANGIYGDAGEAQIDESAPVARGPVPDVVRAWEDAAKPAAERGHNVAFVRTSIVLSDAGGALAKMMPMAKFGINGPLGSGRQWWSWISLADEVRAIVHLIDNPDITGPVNMSAPLAVRQQEFAHALGRSLRRPAIAPAPASALRIALGEFANELLQSRRMMPAVLRESDFEWSESNLDQVLDRATFGRSTA